MLTIRSLTCRYRHAASPALAGLDLDLAPGRRLAVLGPSEAGKSTLAFCLAGLIPRMVKAEVGGRLEVAGINPAASRPRDLAGRVGLLFQDFEAQLCATRVDLEVAFGPENLALPRPELIRRVAASLGRVGLTGLEGRDPITLSGGQKQRLALAGVLALEPGLLILDEPLSDLDPRGAETLLATLQEIQTPATSLLLLGQDLRLTRHCDRIALLDRGRVVAYGTPGVILRQVETFRALGLRPPQLPALFHDLGQPVLPLNLARAEQLAREQGWDRLPPAFPEPPPPGLGPDILALLRVTFAYPGQSPILQDFSFTVRQGEIVAIMGPNGGGKTTLVKLLRGLLTPQAGEVWAAGRGGQQEAPAVGFVFQNPDYQLFAEKVWDEVAYGPRQCGMSDREVEARVEAALRQVHLRDRAADDPFSLSKGQRQRLAVAAVLALAPQVIILDEPTTGLDHREQVDMLDLVRQLQEEGGTIIMVTHSMWAATHYATRLVVIDQGRLVLDGPPAEVLRQEETLAACQLLPPPVWQLSRRLGFTALTPAAFKARVTAA